MDSRPPFGTYYERAVGHYPSANRGRCQTCGFLANLVSGDSAEIPGGVRNNGIDRDGKTPIYSVCYVDAQPIWRETETALRSGKSEVEAVKEVFHKDRKCADWYPYRPGASPLWHYEDMRTMYLEQARAQRERETSTNQAQIQADHKAIAADSLKIAQALKDAQDATGRFTTKWTYIAVGVAIAALLLIGVTYIFPELGPSIGHLINAAWAPSPKP
jgi:hypothetical protein